MWWFIWPIIIAIVLDGFLGWCGRILAVVGVPLLVIGGILTLAGMAFPGIQTAIEVSSMEDDIKDCDEQANARECFRYNAYTYASCRDADCFDTLTEKVAADYCVTDACRDGLAAARRDTRKYWDENAKREAQRNAEWAERQRVWDLQQKERQDRENARERERAERRAKQG
jgi:hypothetical protein